MILIIRNIHTPYIICASFLTVSDTAPDSHSPHHLHPSSPYSSLRPKKKFMLPSPDQNLKIGSVGQFFFFFFFFFFTYRERVEFSNIFFKVSKWGKLGGMQSKRINKCFFRPLNTNFSKFFAQIWHFQQQKKHTQKKPDPVFSHFTVGRERAT